MLNCERCDDAKPAESFNQQLNLNDSIIKTLCNNGLSLHNIIMLSSEGPNVNISLKKKLITEIQSVGSKSLVEIGSCNIHTAHNAFRAGLTAVPTWSVEEFVTDVFYWLKNYPSQQEDI